MVTAARSPLWPDSRSCVIVSAPEAGLRGPEGGSARGCSVKTPVWAGASQVGPGPRPGSDGEAERPVPVPVTMAVFHDEVEIEDFQYDEDSETYFYPCPCGDNFCITKDQFTCGETVPAPSTNKELVKC